MHYWNAFLKFESRCWTFVEKIQNEVMQFLHYLWGYIFRKQIHEMKIKDTLILPSIPCTHINMKNNFYYPMWVAYIWLINFRLASAWYKFYWCIRKRTLHRSTMNMKILKNSLCDEMRLCNWKLNIYVDIMYTDNRNVNLKPQLRKSATTLNHMFHIWV